MDLDKMSLQELEALQAKHRQQMTENREKTRRRKSRNHKLIVMGAEVAGYIPNFEAMEDERLRWLVSSMIIPMK